MKNKLIAIMLLLSPLWFFGQPWHSIEYLSDGKIIKRKSVLVHWIGER